MKIKLLIFLIFCLFAFSLLCFFFYNKPYFCCLNIKYNRYSMPTTEIKIDDKKYLVTVDLGSKVPLFLTKKNLSHHLKKERKEKTEWRDFNGKKYFTNSYLLSEIKLKEMIIKNVIVSEVNEECLKNTTIAGTPDLEEQYIGRPIFEKFKVLLDFKNDKIFISNDLKKLKNLGFDISSYVKVPCKKARSGLVLEVKTDLGNKKLSIDTGFTITALRNSPAIPAIEKKYGIPIYKNKKFQIQDKDFGPFDLFFIDITTELSEIDGFLGMDFLKHHTIYIDFPNKVAYLSRE